MKIKPTAPEAPDMLAQRTAELDVIRKEIAAAEAALYALAESDDDAAFESASLNIERLRRAELRAEKRLAAGHKALAEAKASDEQGKRRELHSAGQKASAEVERLAGEYATHANAIADVLRKIDKLRPALEAANATLPDDERTIDAHALGIHLHVDLPPATKDGPKFWWRAGDWTPGPLDPPTPPITKYIEFNGAFVPFDARNPAHLAVREARRSTATPPTSKSPSQPVNEFGERTLPDGTRKIKLPPSEWPSRPSTN